ncbi:MAG: hypothetical protein RIR26_1241, partial [Pseudomonadota bacterium]
MSSFQFPRLKSLAIVFSGMILLCSCGAGRNNSLSKSNIMTTRKGLSVAQWFSKKDLTPEEIKTVD